MSAGACKAALCCSNLRASLKTIEEFAERDEFTEDQLEKMADVAEKANHKIQRAALNEND